MYIFIIVMCVLWFALTASMLYGLAPYAEHLSASGKIVLVIVVAIGTPFMFIVQGIETILDSLLAEGWNDDEDDDKPGY